MHDSYEQMNPQPVKQTLNVLPLLLCDKGHGASCTAKHNPTFAIKPECPGLVLVWDTSQRTRSQTHTTVVLTQAFDKHILHVFWFVIAGNSQARDLEVVHCGLQCGVYLIFGAGKEAVGRYQVRPLAASSGFERGRV